LAEGTQMIHDGDAIIAHFTSTPKSSNAPSNVDPAADKKKTYEKDEKRTCDDCIAIISECL